MLQLRQYQHDALQQVFAAWRAGARSVLLVCPTGSGKRYMALWLLQYAHENRRKVLFVGNRRLLINQAADDAERFEVPYGVIMADVMQGDHGSRNQIASLQTLESRCIYEKWSNFPTGHGLPEADLLIHDEAHSDSDRFQKLAGFYPAAKILGLTATPLGSEGRAISPHPYDCLIEGVKNSELIAQGHLLPTKVFAPSEPSLDGVKVVNKQEYNQTALGKRVQECHVFADVFKEWEPYLDRATVAFVPGVAFGNSLCEQFNRRLGNGTAHIITAKTKPAERARILDTINSDGRGICVSVDVLREGFDLPVLSCGIDLQPNAQLRTFWQKLGRIKRPFGTQATALWLDFAGNYWRFPHPDEDPEWPQGGTEETSQEVIERKRKESGDPQPIMCPACSFVRSRGPSCPNCGRVAGEAIRRIRMGTGELKEVPAVARQAKQASDAERLFTKWQSRLFGALRSGLSYAQCAHLFQKQTGRYPDQGWVGTFPKGSLEWKLKPADQFTPGKLAQACRVQKEKLSEPG
jgi:superfamily II DNA or RNA helicase